MEEMKETNGFIYWVLITIILVCLLYAGKLMWWGDGFSKERESITEIIVCVVKVAREKYDTENVTLLKELEDGEGYIKYEIVVEDKVKQAIYVKDTTEVVVID